MSASHPAAFAGTTATVSYERRPGTNPPRIVRSGADFRPQMARDPSPDHFAALAACFYQRMNLGCIALAAIHFHPFDARNEK
jgi:hypothetical protein